jgi:peptidoglycan hydrolase-like protein with peptidoglycan-binding domain
MYSGKTIKFADKGPDVVWLQSRLSILGLYTDKVDGQFGSKTLAATKSFQTSKGLIADGIVGPKTYAALEAVPVGANTTSPIPTSPSSPTTTPAGSTAGGLIGGNTTSPVPASASGSGISPMMIGGLALGAFAIWKMLKGK